MRENYIYFLTKTKNVVDSLDIKGIADAKDSIILDEDNADEIREYTKSCLGIDREIVVEKPEDLAEYSVCRAAMLYKELHKNEKCSMMDAHKHIISYLENKKQLKEKG